jgi:hypothetical protein
MTPPTSTAFPTTDKHDDFDAGDRNHAFDNDFDLDMHEPGRQTNQPLYTFGVSILLQNIHIHAQILR